MTTPVRHTLDRSEVLDAIDRTGSLRPRPAGSIESPSAISHTVAR